MMGKCVSNRFLSTFHPFCCQYAGARTRPHRAVQHTLRNLIEQGEGYADVERHVLELYDWVNNDNGAAPNVRCAISDVVFWCPGVLQQLWIDVSVHCPHEERDNESASNPGVAAVAGEAEKTKRYGTAVRPLVFETYGRVGEGTKLQRDLVTAAAVQPACGWAREDPAGPSIADCTSRHILESASRGGSCLLSFLYGWQSSACIFLFGGASIATVM